MCHIEVSQRLNQFTVPLILNTCEYFVTPVNLIPLLHLLTLIVTVADCPCSPNYCVVDINLDGDRSMSVKLNCYKPKMLTIMRLECHRVYSGMLYTLTLKIKKKI